MQSFYTWINAFCCVLAASGSPSLFIGLTQTLMYKEQELSKVQAELEKLQPFKVRVGPCIHRYVCTCTCTHAHVHVLVFNLSVPFKYACTVDTS